MEVISQEEVSALDELKWYLNDYVNNNNLRDSVDIGQVKEFEKKITKLEAPISEEEIKDMDFYAKKSGSEKMFAFVYKNKQLISIYPLFKLRSIGYNIHGYSHMDDESQNKQIGITIPEVADQLTKINYGHQRMLAHIVKLREVNPNYFRFSEYKKHTDDLRKLLEEGWY